LLLYYLFKSSGRALLFQGGDVTVTLPRKVVVPD